MIETPITSFSGEYRFLSNFYRSPIVYRGLTYPTVEHAFQAAKSNDFSMRLVISEVGSPALAKKIGRNLPLPSDWETKKLKVMEELLREKFRDSRLRFLLLSTGTRHLEEGNRWGDRFWGTVNGQGKNHLGKLLMQVRCEILANDLREYDSKRTR